LNNIFYPNSPLHDLGVILRGNRIVAANCQFPIAEGHEIDASLGSRHLAALAMSYETGALVLVVSEETGTISIADEGKLIRFLSLDDLAEQLTERLRELDARPVKRRQQFRWFRDSWRYARHLLVVAGLTLTIWFLADQASQTVYDGAKIKIRLESGAGNQAVALVEPTPPIFNVTFRGSTRAINQIRGDTAEDALEIVRVLDPDLQPAQYTASTRQLLSQSADIRRRGLQVSAVVPENLTYLVERMQEISMPIRVSTSDLSVDDVKISPPTASVFLTQRDLAKIPEEARFVTAELDGRLNGKPENETVSLNDVPLSRTIHGVRATIAPQDVDVSLRIAGARMRKRISGLSVVFFVPPHIEDNYDIIRKEMNEFLIEIEVEGDRALVSGLEASAIEAIARIDSILEPPSPDFQAVDVEIRLPRGVSLVGPAPTVNVRLSPRSGESN
ncbi:MAG: diadenylate cyclase, partial [Phycisphaerae bacterium]